MKLEQKIMQDLMMSLGSQASPVGLSGADPEELEKRLRLLRMGFEIRTKSVLEREFPRFSQTLSVETWNKLGKQFSRTEASSVEQLGCLPDKFYVSMKTRDFSTAEISALEKDYLVFQCRHAELRQALLQSHLESLTDEDYLSPQPTVFIQMQSPEASVISRSRKSFFEQDVPVRTGQLLLRMQEKPMKLSDIIDILSTDQELSRFLVLSIRNYWLQAPNKS